MSKQQKINDYSFIDIRGDIELFLEKRMENNGDGNPIFIGYNKGVNAPTSEATWYIVMIDYVGDSPVRYKLPINGPQFKYVWDDRATYF
jgi:hypothetical protein